MSEVTDVMIYNIITSASSMIVMCLGTHILRFYLYLIFLIPLSGNTRLGHFESAMCLLHTRTIVQ